MSLLVFLIVVIVVLCLVLWAVHILPFPPETLAPVKPILMVVLIIVAVLIVANRAGLLGAM